MVITIALIAYCLFLYFEYKAAYNYTNSFNADFEPFCDSQIDSANQENNTEWPDNPPEQNLF